MTDLHTNDDTGVTVHLVFSVAGYAAARLRGSLADTWVLIGDGVYALAADNDQNSQPKLHVLEVDLAQRGVTAPELQGTIDLIDDLTLVDLISAGDQTVSWR